MLVIKTVVILLMISFKEIVGLPTNNTNTMTSLCKMNHWKEYNINGIHSCAPNKTVALTGNESKVKRQSDGIEGMFNGEIFNSASYNGWSIVCNNIDCGYWTSGWAFPGNNLGGMQWLGTAAAQALVGATAGTTYNGNGGTVYANLGGGWAIVGWAAQGWYFSNIPYGLMFDMAMEAAQAAFDENGGYNGAYWQVWTENSAQEVYSFNMLPVDAAGNVLWDVFGYCYFYPQNC